MIFAQSLIKSYRKGALVTNVLKGVTFRVAQGEFVAIMGPSGSGKSTLLNILGLLDRPDGGRYLLGGADFSSADDDALSAARNRTIGFVFQQFHLLERASALRNVTLPLLYADENTGDEMVLAERALEAVGLSDRGDYLPSELSGGQQQRVAIARALINDPALILADEPTGNLDAQNATEILDIFRRLADSARTVVLVTHDRGVAERADRILAFEDGRIVADEAMQSRPRASTAKVP
ncbi:MAG TPA: ABC transporter ATP-binding protein [Gammaproteobacteria bacterium]|jgi:putative ABC transport system ATP-binding protein